MATIYLPADSYPEHPVTVLHNPPWGSQLHVKWQAVPNVEGLHYRWSDSPWWYWFEVPALGSLSEYVLDYPANLQFGTDAVNRLGHPIAMTLYFTVITL